MIDGLDHMTIVTADLAASRRFYAEVLGLRDGERPPFDVPGAWLYQGDKPIVHLVDREAGDPSGSTGPFDHFAFKASDLAGTVARLDGHGVGYELHTVPGFGLRQVFVRDPDGVKIELNFAAGERLPGED
jgi:catechol 2,3-dioxygenase-like lactoylglutathione lyase family enzyme